jgi:hypothetical protein
VKTRQIKKTTRAGPVETTLATTKKRKGEDRMESVKPTGMKTKLVGARTM